MDIQEWDVVSFNNKQVKEYKGDKVYFTDGSILKIKKQIRKDFITVSLELKLKK